MTDRNFLRARPVMALALLAGAAPLAHAALPQGTSAPSFNAPASLGGKEFQFSLVDALKRGPVVLYFYPAAFTRGCTIEAHDFAEAMPQYQALGATVVGVSMDGIAKLDKFSVSDCRSKFAVAADPDGKITRSYDAKMPIMNMATRVSYVIAPSGKVAFSYAAMSPDEHVAKTLAAVKALKSAP